jgi:hypothetical protein
MEILAFCSLVIMAMSMIGLYLIHLRLQAAGFMPQVVDSYLVLQEVLTLLYCLLTLLMFGWLMFLYCIRGKICSYNTLMFMTAGVVFLYCGVLMSIGISKEAIQMKQEMSADCGD